MNLSAKNTIILACSSMLLHVEAAQKKMETNFEVIDLDRSLHEYPKKMRERIIETMDRLPKKVETVLVSMGLCGGSWDGVDVSRRVVIPKVDDCITLLLHMDDTQHDNLKKKGHMYFRDSDTGGYSIQDMKDRICEKYGIEFGTSIFGSWFESYTNADIIDTGVYDCYSEAYVEQAQKSADLIRCTLDYVQGSNIILEKLVSGKWDGQFVVAGPGTRVKMRDFMQDLENGEEHMVY